VEDRTFRECRLGTKSPAPADTFFGQGSERDTSSINAVVEIGDVVMIA
jgi:hypothetical protein